MEREEIFYGDYLTKPETACNMCLFSVMMMTDWMAEARNSKQAT